MVEEDGIPPIPALKSGLAYLVSLVSWAQPCFVPAFAGNTVEWYAGLISRDERRHSFWSVQLRTAEHVTCNKYVDVTVRLSAYGLSILRQASEGEAL